MAGPDSVTPMQAILAAKALNPWRKQGGTIPKDMPLPPGTGSFGRFIHEVGYAIDLFLDACQIDPWMLVESSIAATMRAAWEVAFPDAKEAFHIAVGKSVVCTLKQEINEQGTFERIGWDGGKKTLFRIAEVADLAIWRLFLASVLADGLVEWQTAAQQESGCSGPKSLYSSSNAQGGIPAANSMAPPTGLEWITGGFPPAFVPNVLIRAGDEGYIVWHAEVGALGSTEPYPIITWVEDLGTGERVTEVLESIEKPNGAFHAPIMHFRPQVLATRDQHYGLRAKGLKDAPGGNLVFIRGYCACRGTFIG